MWAEIPLFPQQSHKMKEKRGGARGSMSERKAGRKREGKSGEADFFACF